MQDNLGAKISRPCSLQKPVICSAVNFGRRPVSSLFGTPNMAAISPPVLVPAITSKQSVIRASSPSRTCSPKHYYYCYQQRVRWQWFTCSFFSREAMMTDGLSPRIPPPSMLSTVTNLPNFGGGSRACGGDDSAALLPLQQPPMPNLLMQPPMPASFKTLKTQSSLRDDRDASPTSQPIQYIVSMDRWRWWQFSRSDASSLIRQYVAPTSDNYLALTFLFHHVVTTAPLDQL